MAANTGDATAAGYTAEKVSWWNPGSVSSSVRTAPPGASWASSTVTDRPASARRIAATSPFGPAPMTIARSAALMPRLADGSVGGVGGSRCHQSVTDQKLGDLYS